MKKLITFFLFVFSFNLSALDIVDLENHILNQQITILENKIKREHKDLKNPKVFKTEHENLFSVVDTKNIYFTNYDTDFFIIGTLYNNDNNSFVDYNKNLRAKYNNFYLERLDKNKLYKYESPNEIDYIYVFTDPTCPFCKRLHDNINFFLDKGISIYYIPFARNGPQDNRAITALNSIICSDNPNIEFDSAFNNINLYVNNSNINNSCEYSNIIWSYYGLADVLDVKGTPAVYTKNGHLIGGFTNGFDLLNKIEEYRDGN